MRKFFKNLFRPKCSRCRKKRTLTLLLNYDTGGKERLCKECMMLWYYAKKDRYKDFIRMVH